MDAPLTSGRPVVVAPASFKGALSAVDAARAIATGLELGLPGVEVRQVPVADGGEGTLEALLAASGGSARTVAVHDPLGRIVDAALGALPDGTAIVELAQASGYGRVGPNERDPEAASTDGTGELLRAALDGHPARIILTVGGSATTDGGLGLLRALGARLLDAGGLELAGTGADLDRVAEVDLTGLDARLAGTTFEVACDVANPMYGPDGAAHVFAPQKGASPQAVARLDAGLKRWATLIRDRTGVDVQSIPGAGAAGGVAGALAGLLGARLRPGAELVLEAVGLDRALVGAAACITGEGRLDEQTLSGKAPAAVAAAARRAGVPCIGVCGELRLLPGLVRRMGMVGAFPIRRVVGSTDEALASTANDLSAVAAALGGLIAGFGGSPD